MTSDLDIELMQEAIRVARMNPSAPFGCILYDRSLRKIVATGVNQSHSNPLLHGEIAAIDAYAKRREENWSEISLFTTAEPCCMCQGAILWSGISRLVFGTSIDTLSRHGWSQIDISCSEIARRSWRPELKIRPGVQEAECDALFADAIQLRAVLDR
jgi:tRNA(adenine34) deaminase